MDANLNIIQKKLIGFLKKHVPPLQVRKDTSAAFEVAGSKEFAYGKKKVDGIYFATVVLKPKDVRFYFFPIYTNPVEFENISEGARKFLKGKSCFHIKNFNGDLANDFKKMIAKGVSIYKKSKFI
jgi:hypothetical protein